MATMSAVHHSQLGWEARSIETGNRGLNQRWRGISKPLSRIDPLAFRVMPLPPAPAPIDGGCVAPSSALDCNLVEEDEDRLFLKTV
ncbi:hypothetical protein AKJ16_DCAP07561 [Drosera capensis]